MKCLMTLGLLLTLRGYAAEINGVVNNTCDREVLIAANVVLKGDNIQGSMNTISDIYGVFILRDIKPGKYTLEITYTDYISESIPLEFKEDDDKAEMDVYLTPIYNQNSVQLNYSKM